MNHIHQHRILLALLLGVLLCTASGSQAQPAGNSILTATVAGRDVRAVIDGPAFIQPQADTAIVSTSSHKITVERERVLLDGTKLAQLHAAATTVEVTVASGQLTIAADGTPVTIQQLSP
jgi:hypothetical protein